MADVFNIDETFEIAEQIERNGARFYRKAAGIFEASRAKSLLMDLAAMEDRHEKLFKEMRQELKKKSGTQEELYRRRAGPLPAGGRRRIRLPDQR